MEEKKAEDGKKEEKKEVAEKPAEEKKEEKKAEESKDGKESPAPPPPPQEIVLKVFMHCEGCARKVRRCLKGFQGKKKKNRTPMFCFGFFIVVHLMILMKMGTFGFGRGGRCNDGLQE